MRDYSQAKIANDQNEVMKRLAVIATVFLPLAFLKGATVDFVESLQESGFKIDNPNASGSCGCGHSFQVAEGEDAHKGCSH